MSHLYTTHHLDSAIYDVACAKIEEGGRGNKADEAVLELVRKALVEIRDRLRGQP